VEVVGVVAAVVVVGAADRVSDAAEAAAVPAGAGSDVPDAGACAVIGVAGEGMVTGSARRSRGRPLGTAAATTVATT
jgi:hypothetical protein